MEWNTNAVFVNHSSPQSPSEPQPSSPSATPSTTQSEAENFVVVDIVVVAFCSSSAIWVAIQWKKLGIELKKVLIGRSSMHHDMNWKGIEGLTSSAWL